MVLIHGRMLQILFLMVMYATCNSSNMQELNIRKHNRSSTRIGKFPLVVADNVNDYDEYYYKDIGDVADIQQRSLNVTNGYKTDDDEDSTNGDYLDELGSTTDDVFQNFNPDPYFDVHTTHKTTLLPTTTSQNENQVESDVTDRIFRFETVVPNYNTDTLLKCPDGFDTYQHDDGHIVCFLEGESNGYPIACPYANNLDHQLLPYKVTSNKTNWAQPSTKIFDGFGGDFVTSNWSYKFACNDSQDCNNKNQSVCAYSYENTQYSFDDYCKKRFNESCVAADLGTGHKCYCVVKSQMAGKTRNNFCKKLAEPLEPYQNYLLLKLLGDNDKCWIGFYQDGNGSFKWSSTNTLSNYTYWSFTTDFTKTYGAIGHEAWFLENDDTLNCAICEVDIVDHPSVSLRIKFDKILNKVRLRVENAIEVFGGVKCYSYETEYYVDLTENANNYLEIDIYDVNDIPRYYWCKAFQIPYLKPIYSNRILARTIILGHEYAIANKSQIPTSPYFMTQLIFNETNNILYHIHTVPNNGTLEEELHYLAEFVSSEIKSSEMCLPSNVSLNNITISWPQTPIGVTVLPIEPCLQDNGYPVTRKCSGSFLYGSTWSHINGTCFNRANINIPQLYQKIFRNNSGSLVTNKERLGVLEIHTIVNLLSGLKDFTEFIQAIDNLMDYQENNFKEAQSLLNSTDMLLDILESRIRTEDVHNLTLNNIVIQTAHLSHSRTIGFKVRPNNASIMYIYNETEFDDDFDVVVKIPQPLHNMIANCSTIRASPKLIFLLLRKDALFGDVQSSHNVGQNIIRIIIAASEKCRITSAFHVLLKVPEETSVKKKLMCASWVYGKNDLLENMFGYWLIKSSPTDIQSYKLCEFGQDSYCTLVEEIITVINIDNNVLYILGIIVSFVSCLSFVGVFITTIVFKSHSYNHIATINLSLPAAVQLILIFAVLVYNIEGIGCITLAAALHCTTIAQFLWILIIAWLQHKYYVSTKVHYEKFLIQICLLAWGIPLLLVLVMVSTSSFNYGKNAYDFCYATGDNFTYSVLLPVSILLLLILAIFGKIIANLRFTKKIKAYHLMKETSFLQLKFSILLFLLLGITWGLGILTAVVHHMALYFIYSVLACIQEIVIFLFFIVLNDNTRTLWVSVKSVCCMGQSKGYELTPTRKKQKSKYATSLF